MEVLPQSLGEHWLYTVADFATANECAALVAAANDQISSSPAKQTRYRLGSVGAKLGNLYVDAVLTRRLLHMMESCMPALAMSLFGQERELTEMLLSYSPGEPAVNVYYPGGGFSPHTDKQAITMLIPLSAGDAYSGGGTAFWSGSHLRPNGDVPNHTVDEHSETDSQEMPHELVLKPEMGTAILFGGNVTHSGLPISAGVRHLFVVSFTLRPSKREPLPPPQSPEELYAAMLRERESESAGLAADVASADALADFATLLGFGDGFGSDSDDS